MHTTQLQAKGAEIHSQGQVLWMFSSGSWVQMCLPSSGYEVKKQKVNKETNDREMLNYVNPLFS